MSYKSPSEFYCTKCGQRGIPISRLNGKGRESGHLKKLWCLNCKTEWNFAETRECTKYSRLDFKFEFDNNNFDDKGNRILPYGEFRDMMHRKGIDLP